MDILVAMAAWQYLALVPYAAVLPPIQVLRRQPFIPGRVQRLGNHDVWL